jgi:hypothetical protein
MSELRIDFDALDENDRYRQLHSEISKEITRFIKRVRKSSRAEIRVLCVAEAHKDGFPHYHILIHQMGDVPVLHRTLKTGWSWGFNQYKLVEDGRAASYVTKYLSKDVLARVRASLGYGTSSDIGVSRESMTPFQSVWEMSQMRLNNNLPEGGQLAAEQPHDERTE